MANVLINGMGVLGRRLFRMIWDKELSSSLATDLTVTMINDMIITGNKNTRHNNPVVNIRLKCSL